MNGLDWAIALLRCPVCGTALRFRSDRFRSDDASADHGVLDHADAACPEAYPVIDGIPRLLVGEARAALARGHEAWFRDFHPELAEGWTGPGRGDPLVRRFDEEWRRFDEVRSTELGAVFDMYFDIVPPLAIAPDRVVLDAGCGAGRWALELAARGPRVLAVDLGRSVEVARANARGNGRIACVQADLRVLPLAEGSLDWAYSLGVLHHIDDPRPALERIVRSVAHGGCVLLYLYWALDGRGPLYRATFRAVDALRRVTSRLPQPLLVAASTAIALLVYWPLARLSALLARLGLRRLADALPLSFYRQRSLRIMRNDSLDRFGTSIEHRYSAPAVASLMRSAGLARIRISDRAPYWHALGIRE